MDATVAKMQEFLELTKKNKEADEALKESKRKLDTLKTELIEQMEEGGLTSLKDEAGRQIFLQKPEVYASVKKGMKEEAFEVLRKWGLGDLLQQTIHSKTLSTVIKERLANSDPVDEKVFGYFIKKKLGYRS